MKMATLLAHNQSQGSRKHALGRHGTNDKMMPDGVRSGWNDFNTLFQLKNQQTHRNTEHRQVTQAHIQRMSN